MCIKIIILLILMILILYFLIISQKDHFPTYSSKNFMKENLTILAIHFSITILRYLELCDRSSWNLIIDKVWMYEEMMTNDDNVESSLLTSSLLKIRSLYKFCYKLHMWSWRSRWTELCSSCIYEEVNLSQFTPK